MAYTATQLITGAYYAAGIVSSEFETVSGSQSSDGLLWLNDILAEKRVDDGMIPYETTYNFIADIGVEKYFVRNLVQIDTLVFYLDQVRYAMQYTKRNEYFGSSRVENINTLPFQWYWERQTGGGNLYIYFKPDRNYPVEIHGTFNIPPITSLQQDLSSNVTIADLGVPLFPNPNTPGNLNPGQLVVNNYDLAGEYQDIGELLNLINSGIIPGVSAKIVVNDFVLTSTTEPPVPIYLQTSGYPPNGTRFIGPVRAIETSNLNATYNFGPGPGFGPGSTLTNNVLGVLIIDGYFVNLGDRVLIAGQTSSFENGCYVMTTLGTGLVPWVLTRTANYDESKDIQIGDLFKITDGFAYIGATFVQTAEVGTVGSSPILFSLFNLITFSVFSTIQTPAYEIFNAIGFDQFYLTYLRYALADRICSEYNYDTPMNVVKQLNKYEAWINKKSRILDLSIQKTSTLQKRGTFNWAFINLGKGWRPS